MRRILTVAHSFSLYFYMYLPLVSRLSSVRTAALVPLGPFGLSLEMAEA